MRNLRFLALMMTIPLLSGCLGQQTESRRAEELALNIRSEYLAMTSFSAETSITVDYGQRVYEYQLQVDTQGEETCLTLTAPELVAGMTAQIQGEETHLSYENIYVETGPLDEEGLTPLSAIPALLEAIRSGYMTACVLEEDTGLLRIDCGNPDSAPGTGRELSLWFTADTGGLVRGEIDVDGFRCILCEFSQVTKE